MHMRWGFLFVIQPSQHFQLPNSHSTVPERICLILPHVKHQPSRTNHARFTHQKISAFR